jgi:hypothetical protein
MGSGKLPQGRGTLSNESAPGRASVRRMGLFDKLEGAIERGMVALDEAIAAARVGRELLQELRPTVTALPEVVRAAKDVLSMQRAVLELQLKKEQH